MEAEGQSVSAAICRYALRMGVGVVRLVACVAVLSTSSRNLCDQAEANVIYHAYLAVGAASILFCCHGMAFNVYNLAILLLVASVYGRIPCENPTWANYLVTEMVASSVLIAVQVVVELRRRRRQPTYLGGQFILQH